MQRHCRWPTASSPPILDRARRFWPPTYQDSRTCNSVASSLQSKVSAVTWMPTRKEPFYETSAQLGLAASLEGQRRFAEAAEMYIQTAAVLPVSLANRARMDAARCWRLATSYDQAESLLQQVVNDGELLASEATIELAVVVALRNSSTRAAPSVTPDETTTPSSEATP